MKNLINQLKKHDKNSRKLSMKINYKQSQMSYSLEVLWAIAPVASYVQNHGRATPQMPSIVL